MTSIDLRCAKFPNRRRYTTMANAMLAADRNGPDVLVTRCDERAPSNGCGGWHIPEGMRGSGWHNHTSCPTPGKVKYLTEWEAEDRLEYLRYKYPHAVDQRVYCCPFQPWRAGSYDFHYHLTSLPEELCHP